MTIIGIALFMVPFTSLCIFILLWGISDLRNQKRESRQSQKLNQEHNKINSTSSPIHRLRRREHKGSAERQAKSFAKYLRNLRVALRLCGQKIPAVLFSGHTRWASLIFQS
ncbi:MAG: hypothetical protein ACKVZH_05575 [Blastocatellia bacterium]